MFTYIHSKLMVVDDRFLTVGSANTTNRSLGSGLGAEPRLGGPRGPRGRGAAARHPPAAREPAGGAPGAAGAWPWCAGWRARSGWWPWLDDVAAGGKQRLRLHPLETVFDQSPLLKPLEPEELIIDPEDSLLDRASSSPCSRSRDCSPRGSGCSRDGSSGRPSAPTPRAGQPRRLPRNSEAALGAG